jgi:hypothetical protein
LVNIGCEASRLKIEPIATFLAVSSFIHIVLSRKINDLDQASASQFARSARRDVVWVTRDPQAFQTVASGQRQQQATRSCGVTPTSVFWIHPIADMPGIHHNVFRIPNSQVDVADFCLIKDVCHFESVNGHHIVSRIAGEFFSKEQLEIIVNQSAWIEKFEHLATAL